MLSTSVIFISSLTNKKPLHLCYVYDIYIPTIIVFSVGNVVIPTKYRLNQKSFDIVK